MINQAVMRFLSATGDAKPIDIFDAPVSTDDGTPDFQLKLQALADDRTERGIDYYHSLSLWDGGHRLECHEGTTCGHLAYTNNSAELVKAILREGEVAFYSFPIKDGRRTAVMFVFPLLELLNYEQTTRFNTIMASMIDVKGLLPDSHFYSYFFHFAKGARIEFDAGAQFGKELIEEFAGKWFEIKNWRAA